MTFSVFALFAIFEIFALEPSLRETFTIFAPSRLPFLRTTYSTVTLLARLRGLSTLQPRMTAA